MPDQIRTSKLTAPLVLRVTRAQRLAFEERASITGLSVSAWARMILLRQIRIDQRKEMNDDREEPDVW